MKKLLSLSLIFVLLIVSLSSCKAASKFDVFEESISMGMGADNGYYPSAPDKYYDGALEYDKEYAPEIKDSLYEENVSRKQIKNASIRMQTKEYESFMKKLSTIVDEFNGYVQSSSQNGSNYGSTQNRSSYVVVRIPSESFEEFKAAIGENCNITHVEESVRDVTTVYTSLESRIQVLEAEESSLVAMLENAQKYLDSDVKNYSEVMKTMLTVKERLLVVQSDLAAYRSELNSYASQVAYSTFTLNIYEVDRFLTVEEPKTMWEEMGTRLSDNLYSIGQGARSFLVWLVSSLPYILIWGVVIAVAAIALIKFLKYTSRKDSELKPPKSKKDKESE